MGRFISRGLVFCVILIAIDNDVLATAIVHDPTSFASIGTMIKSGTEQLKTAKDIASTASESLNTVTKSFGELQTMNSVLGKPLSGRFLNKLMGLRGASRDYGGLLHALSSDKRDNLRAINSFSRGQFGTEDKSNILGAKDYFQRKFFPTKKKKFNVRDAQKIKYHREQSSRDSVLTTLAISHTHKENLKKDHEELLQISNSANGSAEINQLTLIQTKLLERIAQSLEKIILLQAQQLDFMAKTHLEGRGASLASSSNTGEE